VNHIQKVSTGCFIQNFFGPEKKTARIITQADQQESLEKRELIVACSTSSLFRSMILGQIDISSVN